MRLFLFIFAFSVCQAIYFMDGDRHDPTAVTAIANDFEKSDPMSKEVVPRKRRPGRPSRPSGSSSYRGGSATQVISFGVLLLSLLTF